MGFAVLDLAFQDNSLAMNSSRVGVLPAAQPVMSECLQEGPRLKHAEDAECSEDRCFHSVLYCVGVGSFVDVFVCVCIHTNHFLYTNTHLYIYISRNI